MRKYRIWEEHKLQESNPFESTMSFHISPEPFLHYSKFQFAGKRTFYKNFLIILSLPSERILVFRSVNSSDFLTLFDESYNISEG